MESRKCVLCDRTLDKPDRHHLIPKTFGGKQTDVVLLHRICHEMLHATFTERDMLKYYHTIERILEHDGIQKFVKWVKKKPADFYQKTKMSTSKKRKR